jgi:small-conductance mechanosensitive channel
MEIQPIFIAIKDQALILAPKILLGLLVLASFWCVAIGSAAFFRSLAKKARLQSDILTLLARTLQISVILAGAVSALAILGVNVGALVAGLGLTSFALGFAVKDALSNILAGALILFYRPFRRGDHISVTGFEGCVIDIDLRYTTLETKDRIILIPNSNLFTNPVVLNKKAKDANEAEASLI